MEVKGTAIAFIPSYIRETYGEADYNKWLETLPPTSRLIFDRTILAAQWYGLREGMSIPLRRICELFFHGDNAGAVDIGRYSADFGLKGVYKIFVKLGSPESLAKKATTILPTYYRPCAMGLVKMKPNLAVLRTTHFPDMDAYIENRIAGWMQRAVEISGGIDTRVAVTSSLAKGAPFSEYKVTWN